MPKSDLMTEYELLYEELRHENALAPFQAFFKAVKEADDAMGRLSRRDQYGRMPALTAERKKHLMDLHMALAQAAEDLIANQAISPARKDAVKKISALGANYYRHLQSYDPAARKSLPEILEQARTLTLDLRHVELADTMGGEQSKRQPLTFLDDKGREITGVFTPQKHTDVWNRIQKGMDAQIKQGKLSIFSRTVFQEFWNRLDSPKGAAFLGLPENADRRARLDALNTYFFGKNINRLVDATADIVSALFSTEEETLTPANVKSRMKRTDIVAFLGVMDEYGTEILNNSTIAKIHDGARMDTRNAAMSTVAELLNVPNLLAKSVPMRVIRRDGKPVEGTFMMEAKGVDLENLRPEDSHYGKDALQNLDGKAMKSIADLQVLDYICGNTDRHLSNVTYQFKDGKLASVQGFDNETAFGTLVPKDGEFVAHLVLPEYMAAVSQSMAERLNQITPSMLKYSLRGYDLTEEELDAACQRMQQVKDAIQKSRDYDKQKASEQKQRQGKEGPQLPEEAAPKGHLKILSDQEFRNLTWDQTNREYEFQRYKKGKLQKERAPGNFFTKAGYALPCIRSFFRKQRAKGIQYTPLRSERAIGEDNRAIPSNLSAKLKEMENLEIELSSATDGNRTSPHFEKMHNAVKDCVKFYRDLNTRISNAKTQLENGLTQEQKDQQLTPDQIARDTIITIEDLHEMQELNRELQNTAQDYLGTKKPNKKYKPYTETRIELAGLVLLTGKTGSKISEKEIETSVRNERELLEQYNREIGDRLEAADQQPQQAALL